jgi:hypothetical protein
VGGAEAGGPEFSATADVSEGGPDTDRLHAAVTDVGGGESPDKGGILEALLASPLIGSELDLARPREVGRKVDISTRKPQAGVGARLRRR